MPKINLVQAKGNSFYCDGVLSVGVYCKNKMAILIDSGISKDVAKEVDKSLALDGIQIGAIINTHGHGDHCGGNAFFQQKYPQIKIFCTESERPFIEDPFMAPICFCGGASAFEAIKKCRPIAPQQVSKVTDVIAPYQDQKLSLCGEVFEIITLPGHTRGMIAVKTPDNVLYCGDAMFGQDALKKHPVLFYTFIGDALGSFKKLKGLIPSVDVVISYHGGVISEATSLIEDLEKSILEIKNIVILMLRESPRSLDEITARIMQLNKIPDDLISFVLTKTTIQAYVAELEREKLVEIRVTNGSIHVHILNRTSDHRDDSGL